MDANKFKAVETAIAGAKSAIKALVDSEVQARSFDGLPTLLKADTKLDEALDKMADVQDKITERANKAKEREDKRAAKKAAADKSKK